MVPGEAGGTGSRWGRGVMGDVALGETRQESACRPGRKENLQKTLT